MLHSPQGGSVAKMLINCRGSINLPAPTTPEIPSPFAQVGTACHEVQAQCLAGNRDVWEFIGAPVEGVEITADLAGHITRVVGECRSYQQPGNPGFVETKVTALDLHPDYHGTSDFTIINGTSVVQIDAKYGEGVAVEVEGNEQCMYYVYPILRAHPEIKDVTLVIAQPRAYHPDGAFRSWQTTAAHITEWAETVLLPAMHDPSTMTNPGSWCQFCRRKLICPTLNSLYGAAATLDHTQVVVADDLALGMSLQLAKGVRQYLKALEDEGERRAMAGRSIPGMKLVRKKGNRVWKPEAEDALWLTFGKDAFIPEKLKSPSQIEELGPGAKKLTHEYAFTPDTGLTIALEDDPRVAVTVPTLEASFGAAVAQLEQF